MTDLRLWHVAAQLPGGPVPFPRSRSGVQPVTTDGALAAAHRDDSYTTRLTCPGCVGPVYVPTDSDRERVTCADTRCELELVTRQTIGGVCVDRMEMGNG